jgi:hypothetical protein
MRAHSSLTLAAATLGLAGWVSAAPLQLPDDHPASPKASSGFVETPTAIADYKSADDFAARAAAAANAPAGHGGVSGMSGMQHGDMQAMPGMQHGEAPGGAGNR